MERPRDEDATGKRKEHELRQEKMGKVGARVENRLDNPIQDIRLYIFHP